MAYNAELQMLREFYLLIAPRTKCFFCGEPIMEPRKGNTFGHRRHTKVWELNFTVHHDDENRDNNADTNLKSAHSTCHRKHHKSKRGASDESEEKGQEEKEGDVNVRT